MAETTVPDIPATTVWRKPMKMMDGSIRETDYPPDAQCATCEHRFDRHRLAANCDVCDDCERPDGVVEWASWHVFAPVAAPFSGSASAERAAYEAAMGRGSANE